MRTKTDGLFFFPHSGAFKTLDKDNNGTIKVNVQEVKYDLNYFKLDFGVLVLD